ncbi:MAG: Gfo/Idh/MocA family oxidoreductase [Chitinophagaceae bacterium]|nr:MAG: Gfo/Idh/MocA family oxidoreductase [Chitinophagaceae bacterium]
MAQSGTQCSYALFKVRLQGLYRAALAPVLDRLWISKNVFIMKWGIIGPGDIARNFVRDFSELSSLQQVSAIYNHRKKTAKEFADEFGVNEVFTDLDSFIREGDAEIVYISTPHTKHYDEVKACLAAGLHVLCEKPMAINRRQYEELYELAAMKNVYLLEGMWLRFLPHITRLLEQTEAGTIGRPLSLKASMCYQAPKDPDSRYFDPELGGGSLLDLGVYTVFLAVLLFGKPDSIAVTAHLTDQGIDDCCAILLGYADGRHALLESSLLYNTQQPAVLTGEKGEIHILTPWFEKSPGLEIYPSEGGEPIRRPVEWQGHGLHFEAAAVLDDIAAGRTSNSLFTPAMSLEIITVMDEIRRQAGIGYDEEEKT